MPMPAVPMLGRRFGRLIVTSEFQGVRTDKSKEKRYICKCDCGEETDSLGSNLRKGSTLSCGCWIREKTSLRSKTHGMRWAPEYGVWRGIKERCGNPKAPGFANYGARGIGVCEEWRKSFVAFYRDMGPRPSDRHSIERVDNSSGYNPGNCVWATDYEQNINVRMSRNNKTGVTGVIAIGNSWRAQIRRRDCFRHLGTYKDFFEACCARKSAEQLYGS